MDRRSYSVHLSKALDILGYSYKCIKQRQKSWELGGESLSAGEDENVTVIIAGSKAEGVSRVFEGDYDMMVSLNDFICYGSFDDMKIKRINSDERPNEHSFELYKRKSNKLDDEEEKVKNGSRNELNQKSSDVLSNRLETVKVSKKAVASGVETEELSIINRLRCDNTIESTNTNCNEVDSISKNAELIELSEETYGVKSEEAEIVKYDGAFLLDTENVSPGYAILKVLHLNEKKLLKSVVIENRAVVQAKLERNGRTVLSSEYFSKKAYECDEDEITQTVEGPAGRSLADPYLGSVVDVDSVFCIPCVCKHINHSWVNRKRKFDWPSKKLIAEVSRLDGHVVPVGFKGSETSNIEWRICYTVSELKLIQSFNETQIKLHALVKIVGKSVLKPVCPDITSYILKNVLLWMAEKVPSERFEIENLYGLLIVALKFLRYVILKRCLPNYMIPQRNLFSGKLSKDERNKVLVVLDGLLNEKPFFIENCRELEFFTKAMLIITDKPKLADYMVMNRLQFETIFRQNWRDVWEFRTPDFLSTCLKQCNCLNSLLSVCKMLGVSSKTKERVIEELFWWITGKEVEKAATDNSGSSSASWCWSDSGEIIPLFQQKVLENRLLLARLYGAQSNCLKDHL